MTNLERLVARALRRLLAVLVPLERLDRDYCSFANDTDEED